MIPVISTSTPKPWSLIPIISYFSSPGSDLLLSFLLCLVFPGRQEFHVACPDEETWLLCLLLGGDCLKIPNRRQTAALPGKFHAALSQTAILYLLQVSFFPSTAV